MYNSVLSLPSTLYALRYMSNIYILLSMFYQLLSSICAL